MMQRKFLLNIHNLIPVSHYIHLGTFLSHLRLLAGQNPYDIARFTGTSLSQIENHYDNVKDAQVSDRLLKDEIRFDKNNDVIIKRLTDH